MMNEMLKETIILILDYVTEKEENPQNQKEILEIKKEIQDLKENMLSIKQHQGIHKTNSMLNEVKTNIKPVTPTKPKEVVSDKKLILNKNQEKVLNCLPEMTNSECNEYFKRIISKCYGISGRKLNEKLVNEPTARNIAKQTGLTITTVNNLLKKIREMENIWFIPVNDVHNAPRVYVRIIPDIDGSPSAEYHFTKGYNNIGFELINNMYIKSKKGKTFDVNAKQLKKLSGMVDGKVLTNSLFKGCCNYLKDCGVDSSSFECIIYHLVKGHFSMILYKYDQYLREVNNPHFELYNNTLRVNGQDTKLNVDEIKKMIDGIPYGYSDEVREEYVRGLIDKNSFCPSECIRLIVDNYDDYSLKVLLKKEGKFVENNPQKRREKGFI